MLVAATYLPHECSTDRCVRERLVGLGPLSAVRIDPMLTVAQLNGLVVRSPHWRSIAPTASCVPVAGARRVATLSWMEAATTGV